MNISSFNLVCSETNAAYHDAATRLGLSDSAMTILYILRDTGRECMLSELGVRSGLSKQTINSSVSRLERDGIVRLEAVDGRRKQVALTDKGIEFAGKTVMRVMEIEEEIISGWTEQEREVYLALSERFLRELREKTKELGK